MTHTIFVMKDKRLVEHGSHDELLARAGVYSKLFEIQQGVAAPAG